jgi:hypothetical protein
MFIVFQQMVFISYSLDTNLKIILTICFWLEVSVPLIGNFLLLVGSRQSFKVWLCVLSQIWSVLTETASYISNLFSSYMQAGECQMYKIRKNEKNGHKTNMIGWHIVSVIGHFIHLNMLPVVGWEFVRIVPL